MMHRKNLKRYKAIRSKLLAMRDKSAADQAETEAIVQDFPVRCLWNAGWWIDGGDGEWVFFEACRDAAEVILELMEASAEAA
jgi:hypothetical protein